MLEWAKISRGLFPAFCWIDATKNSGSSRQKEESELLFRLIAHSQGVATVDGSRFVWAFFFLSFLMQPS